MNLKDRLSLHPLFGSLIGMRGNQRACVYTEPLFAIPYFLYVPFITLYMAARGLNDQNIGTVLAIQTTTMMIATFFSGIVVDRIGRRAAMLWSDLTAYTLPLALYLLIHDPRIFYVGAVLCGTVQISAVGWNCMMVEDQDPTTLVSAYTWITISGLLAVFFAPLAGWLVTRYGLIQAMQTLFLVALISVTTKFLVFFFVSSETGPGLRRIQETRSRPASHQFAQLMHEARDLARDLTAWQILIILITLNVGQSLTGAFFPLLVTRRIGVAESYLAYFPVGRSAVMLIFFFIIPRWVKSNPNRRTILTGLGLLSAALVLLIVAPPGSIALVWVYVFLDATGFALVMPRKEAILALYIDPQRRARILALLFTGMMAATVPFNWLGGLLSQQDRRLPFVLILAGYALCAGVIFRLKLATDQAPLIR